VLFRCTIQLSVGGKHGAEITDGPTDEVLRARMQDTVMNSLKAHAGHTVSSPIDADDFMIENAAQYSGAALAIVRDEARHSTRSRESFAEPQAHAKAHSLRAAIKVKGKILFVNLCDVVSVEAKGKCVCLQRSTNSYLLRESISAVAEKLETEGFIRIHRSVLVNTSFVEEIRPLATGEYCLRVEGGKEYTVTRTYKRNLKALAQCWIGTGAFFPG